MINTDSSSEEDAVGEIKRIIDDQRRELQRLVVEEKESVVPRVCKDLFWKMSRVVHLFYMNDDGFTLENMFGAVKDVLHKPISSDLKWNYYLMRNTLAPFTTTAGKREDLDVQQDR